MECFLCGGVIGGEFEWHHPKREEKPDWTVVVHVECHRGYHSRNGDYREWGGMASTAGRGGYERALEACPEFHILGGEGEG